MSDGLEPLGYGQNPYTSGDEDPFGDGPTETANPVTSQNEPSDEEDGDPDEDDDEDEEDEDSGRKSRKRPKVRFAYCPRPKVLRHWVCSTVISVTPPLVSSISKPKSATKTMILMKTMTKRQVRHSYSS